MHFSLVEWRGYSRLFHLKQAGRAKAEQKEREALDSASLCGQIHLCQCVSKIGTIQQFSG